MKRYRVYNIDWDCDEEEDLQMLPTEMIVEDEKDLDNEDYELSDFISDIITDITGFCHRGCDYDEYKEPTKEDIIGKIAGMNNLDTINVTAFADNDVLRMGVMKVNVMDGIDVFLCNVYGSQCDFESFPIGSDMTDEEVYEQVVNYFYSTAKSLCDNNVKYFYVSDII